MMAAMQPSFWEKMFGSEYPRRADINEALGITAPVTCTKYERTVPARRTLMTENGPICAPAYP